MRRIREVLRLRAALGPNLSAISAGAKLARSTVRAYLDRATAAGLDAATADGLSEAALEAALFPATRAAEGRGLPDWAAVDQELGRHKHVTRKLRRDHFLTSSFPGTAAAATPEQRDAGDPCKRRPS